MLMNVQCGSQEGADFGWRVRNVVAGMLGALLGAWIFAGLFGSRVFSPSGFGLDGLAEAAIGAIVLILLNELLQKVIGRPH
jgi:uncharacterized membrane protein YeaQ/YmgE (transglycosylase-associated protein family)